MSIQTENGHGLPARPCSAYPSETKAFKRLTERIEHDIHYWTTLRDAIAGEEWCPMRSGGVGDGGEHESHCLLKNPLTFESEYLIVPNK